MAQLYTNPKTGITCDRYGNEVVHNPTQPHGTPAAVIGHGWSASHWQQSLLPCFTNMTEANSPVVTSPNDRLITEPLSKAPPQTP